MEKSELIQMLHQNENDYHELPMYGLMSDWYLRYWHLHIALYQYLELDKEDYFGPWPLKQWVIKHIGHMEDYLVSQSTFLDLFLS